MYADRKDRHDTDAAHQYAELVDEYALAHDMHPNDVIQAAEQLHADEHGWHADVPST